MPIQFKLDRDDSSPLYLQLQEAIRGAIAANDLLPRAALPPERNLAADLGVSRITIRKAIDGLVAEGLLVRRQGAGSFVAGKSARIEKSLSRITSFSEDMIGRGLTPRSEWISKVTRQATPEEALALGLSPNVRVHRLSRIRFADDLPMAIEESTLLASALPSLETVGASIYEALDHHGNRPVRALQRLRAVEIESDDAKRLGVAPGSAALLIERRGFHRDGFMLEVTRSLYRGDAYDFLAELNGPDH